MLQMLTFNIVSNLIMEVSYKYFLFILLMLFSQTAYTK